MDPFTKPSLFTKLTRGALVLALVWTTGCATPLDEEEEKPSVTIEGTKYPVVVLGDHEWTAINYRGPGGTPYGGENPDLPWGRYYTRDEAEAVSLPTGWRLPTREDFVALAEGQGVVFTKGEALNQEAIARLLSKEGWLNNPGTNASGFNALPGGAGLADPGPIPGDIGEFWITEGRTVSFQENLSRHLMRFFISDQEDFVCNIRFVRDR